MANKLNASEKKLFSCSLSIYTNLIDFYLAYFSENFVCGKIYKLRSTKE